ncbi:aromatic ring-hydroxylating dioxygenase subunit alpha [Noviherbaspirillum cavernae]|uniref:Aromatic ring-hydroxylating dioxygenase subunit alpha n=1 Tax=Noviherbaspirillum cavernae TaxID=2320862 RepID=A0A418X3I5_9BURK|nr:aromatic ring-hydroxylating dioxygenase subunit alpha [Noviherbaspirillum cavernae]RJG06985.1 aromatic ring-hydroxylating dioxygenase subunit alpha [Noviherbaspirillum cavernae]
MFPMNQWYVAAYAWELQDKPVARTILNRPLVLFRTVAGEVAALDDRCCHRALPLSCGIIDKGGIRCGYHGLLYAPNGQCVEIPGQARIPSKCRVEAYKVAERNQIVWIWLSDQPDSEPTSLPPEIAAHDDPRYKYKGGLFHYNAPYQLIHDNLLDLSHLGYVHLKTIGGNPQIHMEAPTRVESDDDYVRVVRWMKASQPPATYSQAWPFKGLIDRWQEIDFHVSHLNIWTGAVDADTEPLDNPNRGGFHMRGFHGITPETETTSHYFWTIASNSHPDRPDMSELVYSQTEATFAEDKVVIEAQYQNMCRFGDLPMIDIHVDAGANRARRIIDRLNKAALQS